MPPHLAHEPVIEPLALCLQTNGRWGFEGPVHKPTPPGQYIRLLRRYAWTHPKKHPPVGDHPSRWYAAGQYAFVLANPRPVPFIRWKGALSLRDAPATLIE